MPINNNSTNPNINANTIVGNVTVTASPDVDLSTINATLHISQKGGQKLEMINHQTLLHLLCSGKVKLTITDLKVYAAIANHIKPNTTETYFSRKQLIKEISDVMKEEGNNSNPIASSQLCRSIKRLMSAEVLYVDNLGVYHVNPKLTFNGKVSVFRAKGLI